MKRCGLGEQVATSISEVLLVVLRPGIRKTDALYGDAKDESVLLGREANVNFLRTDAPRKLALPATAWIGLTFGHAKFAQSFSQSLCDLVREPFGIVLLFCAASFIRWAGARGLDRVSQRN